MMSAAKPLELISVADYLAGERVSKTKHEYAGGLIYAMAGGKNVHNSIAGTFFGAMYTQLRGRPCKPFNSDTKVRIQLPTQTRFYYPDGMVVCEPNAADDTYQDQPVVLAEVVSRSTRRIDEGEKRDAYLTIPTLSAYLIIESEAARVVVYHRTDSGFETKLYEGLDSTVPLEAIEARLLLSELYEGVDFSSARAEEDPTEKELFGF